MSSRRSSFYHKSVVHVVVSSTVQTRVDGMQCKTKCSAAPFFPPRLELPLQCRLMNHTEPAVSSTLWWRKWWTRDGWRRSQYKSLCSLPLWPSPCHQPPGLPMPIDLPMHPLPNWHRLLLYCYNLPPSMQNPLQAVHFLYCSQCCNCPSLFSRTMRRNSLNPLKVSCARHEREKADMYASQKDSVL